MKKIKTKVMLSLAVILALGSALGPVRAARSAPAQLVTYNFTGVITFVSGMPFGLVLSNGQLVAGSFAYDLSQPPAFDTGTVAGYIQSPPSGMTLTISGLTLQSQNYNSFQVINNGFGVDNFNGYFTPISVDGVSWPSSISFSLSDFSQTALSSTKLPASLQVAGFNQRGGSAYDSATGGSLSFSIDSLETPMISVAIDVKPDEFQNSINPQNTGVVPVAVLTTDTFDAATIEPTTNLFGETGTEAAPEHFALEDVDEDGDIDMIFQLDTKETGIRCGDTLALLSGETSNGQVIKGSDMIQTVGCK